jgi:hypothetical protein
MRAVLTLACLSLLAGPVLAQPDTLWTRRENGAGNRDDALAAVLADQSDNVIIVGSVIGVGTGFDIRVVKYDSAGGWLWNATVAGAGSVRDYAIGGAVGPDGAIYVTGTTGGFPNYNIVVAKLAADGSESWRRTWAGEGDMADVPSDIAVDADGHCYVTGYTTRANGIVDIVTMKLLTSTGLPAWVSILKGEGGGNDYAKALALGPGGTVYITGYSARQYMDDYLTAKYNAAGDTLWVRYYNHTGNATDQASAIAVDAAGNAYVTGKSATVPGIAGINHYATLKYSSSGSQGWLDRYTGTGQQNEAVALAIDATTVYVTGRSGNAAGNFDIATVAYGLAGGGRQWVSRFDGPPQKDDYPAAIAVRPDGKIAMLGTSVSGSDVGDYMAFRYATDGEQEWATRLSFGNDDQAVALAVDSRNNQLIAGNSFIGGNYDLLVAKFDGQAGGGVAELEPVFPGRPALRFAPSPARGWTAVEHSLAGTAPVTVSLVGADGRVVRRQELAARAGGARLDLVGVAPGVYLVRAESAGRTATGKLLVR